MYSNMSAPTLTDHQIMEIKEIFLLFDKDGKETIPLSSLGPALRALGHCLTNAEVTEIMREIGPAEGGHVNFETFLKLSSGKKGKLKSQKEVIEAFRFFDTESKGIISKAELKHILVNLGEKMCEAEANEFVAFADVDGTGRINYEDLVKVLAAM